MQAHAIIGAGLSGTLTAIRLLQRRSQSLVINIFEMDNQQLFKGVAYASVLKHQLLNVPANHMSLYLDRPLHFYEWLLQSGYRCEPTAFVPRQLFGDYLKQELLKAEENAPRHKLRVYKVEVTHIQKNGDGSFQIFTSDNKIQVSCQELWLCTGNFTPTDIENAPANVKQNERYISNPWSGRLMHKILKHEHVLIVGSGLTMVDQVLSLYKKGHLGKITVVSRRGFLPQPYILANHYQFSILPDFKKCRIVDLIPWFRSEINFAIRQEMDWHSVINALRDYTSLIWKHLSETDKRSFLMHLRPFWETHRHQVPPESWRMLQELRASSQLEIKAARIISMQSNQKTINVQLRPRCETGSYQMLFDKVINCTGPQSLQKNITSPLMVSLIKAELVQSDSLGLGLLISDDLHAINKTGVTEPNLHIIGPPGKGGLWECTALREIRLQTDQILNDNYA